MGRLFAGTSWDRPPTCDRCGELDVIARGRRVVERKLISPESQTARLRLEKRAKGKHVTTVAGLDPEGNDLAGLAAASRERAEPAGPSRTATSNSRRSPGRDGVRTRSIGIQNAARLTRSSLSWAKGRRRPGTSGGRSGNLSWEYQLAESPADYSFCSR